MCFLFPYEHTSFDVGNIYVLLPCVSFILWYETRTVGKGSMVEGQSSISERSRVRYLPAEFIIYSFLYFCNLPCYNTYDIG